MCTKPAIIADVIGVTMRTSEFVTEKWSKKYKDSINCSNPKAWD